MEITIETINQFLEAILKLQEENEKSNNDPLCTKFTELAFRGQPDKNFELLPAIGRHRHVPCQYSILDEERNLIEIAKYKLPNIFYNLPPIDLLAMLQHYGIPTRLLDVTSNPLVALYFAVNNDNEDGEVFVFEYNNEDKANCPLHNAIAETYKFASTTFVSLSIFYENVFVQPYFDEQRIGFAGYTNEQGAEWIKNCCKDILFVHAAENIARQRLQQGFYILFPNKITEDNCLDKIISPIDKNNQQIKRRIIVKKECKKKLQNQLRFLGISEYTLFSDNIDMVCKGIVKECTRISKY